MALTKARFEEIKRQLAGAEQDLEVGDEDQVSASLEDMVKAVKDLLPEVPVEEFRFGDQVIIVREESGNWQEFVGRRGKIVDVEPNREYPLTVEFADTKLKIRANYNEVEKVKLR